MADKLKAGLTVDAELFESVTIYFSDIVGFTKIASRCHPMQVINLLNTLYSLMDSLMQRCVVLISIYLYSKAKQILREIFTQLKTLLTLITFVDICVPQNPYCATL